MFKNVIKFIAIGLCFSSIAQAQIRPPDISTSTSSVWTFRGKMKIGGGTPSISQTEGSFYATSIFEAANSVYLTGLGGSGDKILYRNGSTGQISIVTLNSTLGLTTGTLGVTTIYSTGLTNTSNTITNNVLTGLSGGQTFYGGTGASENLIIDSTTNGTKGNILLAPSGGFVGIDVVNASNVTTAPTFPFVVGGNTANSNTTEASILNRTTATSGTHSGISAVTSFNPGSTSSANYYGGYIQVAPGSGAASNVTGNVAALNLQANYGGSGALTKMFGLRLSPMSASPGTVGTAYGIYLNPFGSATLGTTNNYGIYIDTVGTGLASDYGLFVAGSSVNNSISGKLGVQTSTPTYPLSVGGNASNASAGNISSVFSTTLAATTTYASIASQTLVNPASSSAGSYYGFHNDTGTASGASQNITGNVIGVGGVVTHRGTGILSNAIGLRANGINNTSTGSIANAYGLKVEGFGSATIGTTLNHGIDIATIGTGLSGDFGLYAGGTSKNYFAGKVGIGTTAPQNNLDVATGVAIGTYAGVNTAPSNGLIVSGNVGIGTSSAASPLTVSGTASATTLRTTGVTSASLLGTNSSGDIIAATTGAVTRAATRVVAASNAKDTTNADYIASATTAQTAINNAISDLSSTGGIVYLSEGNFTITSQITLNSNNVFLVGRGKGLTTITRNYDGTNSSNGPMVLVSVATAGVIGMKLNGVSVSTFPNANNHGISITAGQVNSVYRDVWETTNKGTGFKTAATWTDSIIENNIFESNGSIGMDLNGTFTKSVFKGNRTSSNGGIGISFQGTTGGIIEDNYSESNTSYNYYIYTCHRIEFRGNTSKSGTVTGIWFEQSENSQVENNYIDSSGAWGILVTNSNRVNITGNSVYTTTNSGIYVDTSSGVTVIGNNVEATGTNGIDFAGTVTDSVISGNKIHGFATGTAHSSGIYLSTSSRNVVSGNNITNGGSDYAININSGTSNIITGNMMNGTGSSTINDSGTTTIFANQYDGTNLVTKGFQSNMAGLAVGVTATKTSGYTAVATDTIVDCDPSSAGFTITIPTASSALTGKIFYVQNVTSSTNTITVQPTSGNINASASLTITTGYGGVKIFCNGSAWFTLP